MMKDRFFERGCDYTLKTTHWLRQTPSHCSPLPWLSRRYKFWTYIRSIPLQSVSFEQRYGICPRFFPKMEHNEGFLR